MTSSSPGSSSRTNGAPVMSRAGVSEARTQPSSSLPRHRGRKPCGSRTPISRSWSSSTREKAPSGRAAPPSGPPPDRRSGWASRWRTSSSAIRSLSLVTVPGSMPISAARASVLVRLPLWPRAKRHRRAQVAARRGRAVDRLGVVPGGRAGGRVAGVADGEVALEAGEVALVEDVGDQAHVLDDHHLGAVADRHAGRLLAPVLEGVEPVEGQVGDLGAGGAHAEDPARLARRIVVTSGGRVRSRGGTARIRGGAPRRIAGVAGGRRSPPAARARSLPDDCR